MNSVTIFSSLIFAAACLSRVGYSGGNRIEIAENDPAFKMLFLIYDKEDIVSILYFGSDEAVIGSLAKTHPYAQVIQVDDRCVTTKEDFGVEILPTIILRRYGRHLAIYVNPDRNTLDENINKYVNMPTNKIKKGVIEITDYAQLRPEIAEAGLYDDSLTVVYISKDDVDDRIQPLLINDYNVVVFKIDPDISSKVTEEFSHRAWFVKDSSPKILLRKFNKNVYMIFGFEWNKFFTICRDFFYTEKKPFHEIPFRVSIITSSGNSINAVQYPENNQQFKTLIAEAESAKKVILIYIVENNNFSKDDSSVDELASLFPTITVIRVDATKCEEVLTNYADKKNKEAKIKKFPTFIVRAFKINKSRFNSYCYADLSYEISKYIYDNKDPDLPENQPKTKMGKLMVASYPYYNRIKNLMIAQMILR